jgi:hypothetical protein
MNILEKVNNIISKNQAVGLLDKSQYDELQETFVAAFALFFHTVNFTSADGVGRVANVLGSTLDALKIEIQFNNSSSRSFLLSDIVKGYTRFVRLPDYRIAVAYNKATNWLRTLTVIDRATRTKEDIVTEELHEFAARTYEPQTSEEFYHMLGWLTNYLSNVVLLVPEYLQDAAEELFDPTVVKVTDEAKLKGNSYPWMFKLQYKKHDKKPDLLSAVKDATDLTHELITNYGLHLGKQQDADQIRATIPDEMLEYFELGITE